MNSTDILDIRHLTETGDDLKRKILEGVEKNQSPLLLVPLPNILKITTAQFDEMQTDPDLQRMYQSRDFLYHTPLNVMEVRVEE